MSNDSYAPSDFFGNVDQELASFPDTLIIIVIVLICVLLFIVIGTESREPLLKFSKYLLNKKIKNEQTDHN